MVCQFYVSTNAIFPPSNLGYRRSDNKGAHKEEFVLHYRHGKPRLNDIFIETCFYNNRPACRNRLNKGVRTISDRQDGRA